MDGFFGLGLAFALILMAVLAVPALFILTVAFVYVRQQRGQPVDINTGATAYAVILVALGALLVTVGVARMLTAIMAEIDSDYTYGAPSTGFDDDFFDDLDESQDFADDSTGDRQERDIATGLALFVAGAAAIGIHLWLRGWLAGEARLDHGVEGAWETLFTLLVGLMGVALVADMFTQTFGRAIADDETNAAGTTIAQMFAVLGLWGVYGYRALGHLGVFARNPEGGPGGGREI